jgi:hypothetical protein
MIHRIYYLPIIQSVPGILVLPVETNLYNIVLVCLYCKISIFHARFEDFYAYILQQQGRRQL